ncbi:MAG: ThiF family adenylyltransferase [Planctomyces sp.]|nr:ThiF family adenylyltransferase [Planctomyces sp.]
MLYSGIGREGQQRLTARRVTLIGCGALGCVIADALVRAGVGFIRIVDRDFVELSNLQRQSLFTELDVHQHLPKSVAAANRLRLVNSLVEIEPVVADVDYANIVSLTQDSDLLLDGTDNFEIRYLINDVSLELGIPWIFTGCTGSHGQMMPVIPEFSACLRCLMPDPPPPGSSETCDTAGVLGPAIGVIASLQAAMAIRLLVSERPEAAGIPGILTLVDVWDLSFRQMDISRLRDQTQCPACRKGERLWLRGEQRAGTAVLCGRNAVQVSPPDRMNVSLPELSRKLSVSGEVTQNGFLIRLSLPEEENGGKKFEITVFPDGRAIIRGTEDPMVARSLYSRYIGT